MKYGVTKNEYVKLIRRTETALKKELKKPDDKRDSELVSECVESLSYYRSELYRMEKARSHAPALRFARTALIAVLALVLTFGIGATVAEAAGFRVWTAIFKRDAGYLRVEYVPEITAAPTASPTWEDAERSFFEYGDFAAELSANGFVPFPGEWQGYEFTDGGVRSTKDEYYASYTLRSEEGYIRIRMIAKSSPIGKTSIWGLSDKAPAVHLDLDGVDAAYQIDGDYAFATWQNGSCIFSVSVYGNAGCVERLLRAVV